MINCLDRLSDRLPPLMLRELLEGLRTRSFLAAALGMLAIYCYELLALMNGEKRYYPIGAGVVFIMAFFIPWMAVRTMTRDTHPGARGPLLATSMSSLRIILERWSTAFIVAVLCVITALPFGAVWYVFMGSELSSLLILTAFWLTGAAWCTAVALMVHSLCTPPEGAPALSAIPSSFPRVVSLILCGWSCFPWLHVLNRVDAFTHFLPHHWVLGGLLGFGIVILLLTAAHASSMRHENYVKWLYWALPLLCAGLLSIELSTNRDVRRYSESLQYILMLVIGACVVQTTKHRTRDHCEVLRRQNCDTWWKRTLLPGWQIGVIWVVWWMAAMLLGSVVVGTTEGALKACMLAIPILWLVPLICVGERRGQFRRWVGIGITIQVVGLLLSPLFIQFLPPSLGSFLAASISPLSSPNLGASGLIVCLALALSILQVCKETRVKTVASFNR